MQADPGPIHARSHWTRRQFVGAVAHSTAASMALGAPCVAFAMPAKSRARREKIAILATEVRKLSHPQHFIDRFLEGYGWQGKHHYPPMELAALYVDQFPAN